MKQLTVKWRARQFIVILASVFLLQFVLVSISLPVTELFTEKPLFYSDAGYHWYHMKLGINLARTADVVGYDPYFSAGYPGGVIYDPSAKGAMLTGILLQSWYDEIVSYKLYVFASALLAPLCVALALHWLALDSTFVIAGTLMGFLLWWTSVFRWYHTAGMVSFVLGAYLTLPYLVAVFRYLCNKGSRFSWVGLAVTGALGFFYHPLFPVPVAVGTVAILTSFWRSIHWNKILGLALVTVFAVVVNLFWLEPTRYYQIFREFRASYQSIVDANIVWQELLGRWTGHAQGSKEYGTLALLSLWAWVGINEPFEKRISRAFTISGMFLIVFAAVGAVIQSFGTTLQPNRFAPVGYLFLLIPATYGIREISRQCRQLSPISFRRIAAAASLVGVVLAGLFLTNEVRREIAPNANGHYGVIPPEVKGAGAYSSWVVSWLKRDTAPSGRVLFETSKARIYDGARMAGFYAYTSDREFIGGPYPYMHFSGFWDGWLFDKPIAGIGHEEFKRYMDLYNIGWVLVHSEESKKYFDSYSGAVLIADFKQLRAYKLNRDLSYFAEGSGLLKERGHNKIVLSNLSGPEVILKYHFVPGLKSEPPIPLIPIELMDDPTPFVKMVNPPKEIKLFIP